MERKNKKFRIYFKRNKHSRKYKISKKSNYDIQKILKIISILIMIIVFGLMYKKEMNLLNNNNWMKKDVDEFIMNYFSCFKGNYNERVSNDIITLKKYFSLKVILKKGNLSLNLETKEKLKNALKNNTKKNFNLIKNIFISETIFFGNEIIAFNNLIYYCEILGIKNIYLSSKINWLIKNDINTDKIHISLISPNNINCNSDDTFCGNIVKFFFPTIIKSERRSIILKDEIKRNLPQIKINKKDLYIYIRSGDSFNIGGNFNYPIAPYCFYQKIFSNFKFNDIYLISPDDESPIIRKLLIDYPKIKHKFNTRDIDLATLMNAYNLVNSVSSFSLAAINFNDNLINLFEYEFYLLREKINHFHYDIDLLDRRFNIYRMKPSEEYFIKMYAFENTDEQRKLLFKENCKYNFIKTKYSKTMFN